ncbi:MAG: SMC-Scp complex subunit ScpB [Hyphomicrobiales bacterium]
MTDPVVTEAVAQEEVSETNSAENVTPFRRHDRAHQLRVVEALLFAAFEPVSEAQLCECLAEGAEIDSLLEELCSHYEQRGVTLRRVSGKWSFRTADDLSFLLRREAIEQKKLSNAALETLAIIAYHQPVTRTEIEEVRGVSTSKGTLDILLELGWIKLRGRRRVPGRPVTYGTTDDFLSHFGLDTARDLPGINELKGAGLLSATLPADFEMPVPGEEGVLAPDEDPIEDDEQELPLEMHLPEDVDMRGE